MRKLDGYLSNKAQAFYPGALVYCEKANGAPISEPTFGAPREEGDEAEGPKEKEEKWTLERPGEETLYIGHSFHHARQAVFALRAAERHKKEQEEGKEKQ